MMAQSRGLGRILRRGRSLWIAYYHRGQEIRESVAVALGRPPARVTTHDATGLLRARLAELHTGRLVGPEADRLTLAEVLDAYLTHLAVNGAKGLSVAQCECRMIMAGLGDILVRDLTPARIEAWMAAVLERRSRGTLAQRCARLKAALRLAHRQGRLLALPHVPFVRVRNARQGFFTTEQVATLVAALPTPLDDVARFAYLTGWRRGEILGLTWSQVDRQGREIRLGDTKTGDGRLLPIAGELLALIERRWKARALTPWVFHRSGRRITDYYRAWRTACDRAGLSGALLHDFRRTAVRDLTNAGVDPFSAMRLTGHRTMSTFKRYCIVNPRMLADAQARLAAHRGQNTDSSAPPEAVTS